MRIRSKRQMWLFTATITTASVLASELCVLGVWMGLGERAFDIANIILIGAVVPLIVALPVSYVMASMGWQLSQTHSKLRHLADTDPLTGLINRRHFFEQASFQLATCREAGDCVALLVIDADHFKDLNDTYGHAIGDEALISIAQCLCANFRSTDLICRVGGEEFAVLLPGMSEDDAYPLAERVVKRVSSNPLSTVSAIIEYSISCGIADSTTSFDIEKLYKAADDAMYLAKREGRNRVARLAA